MSQLDTSSFSLKVNLATLKTEVDKLDIDKLVPFLADSSKLSDVVKNDAVKKATYDKLVAKVTNGDTNEFVLKNKYQTDKTELENKIPDAGNLATKTALTTVENKIPDVSNLVNKTDYNTKVTEIGNKLSNHNHDKYIDSQEFNKLAADVLNARLAQAKLITKTEFDSKFSILNRKITANKAKHLLVENELNELKTFDSSYFISKCHFDEDGAQNSLVFQPLNKYFKLITNT